MLGLRPRPAQLVEHAALRFAYFYFFIIFWIQKNLISLYASIII